MNEEPSQSPPAPEIEAPGAAGAAGLTRLGWDDRTETLYRSHPASHLPPARVVRVDVDRCVVTTADSTVTATARPLPVVGDWVLLEARAGADPAFAVAAVLDRRSALRRATSGDGFGKVVAANVDVVAVVTGLDREPNVRRLEREVVVAADSGGRPLIVLNKSDMHADPAALAAAIRGRVPGTEVILATATSDLGVDALAAAVAPNLTLVLTGASGVGKSTLVNRLVGSDLMATKEVRAGDRKGQHTTTARHLIPLPLGGVLIDTPGVRSVTVSSDPGALAAAYGDVEETATHCRFSDCGHAGEPGCAVVAAVDDGVLERPRVAHYQDLRREATRLEAAEDPRQQAERRRDARVMQRSLRKRLREKGQK